MRNVFALIAIAFAIVIIFCNKDKRAIFYLLGTFFIPGYFNGAHFLLPVAFIVSLIYHGELEKEIYKFPLKYTSLAIFIIYLLVTFINQISFNINTILTPVKYFFETYIFCFVGFSLINNVLQWKKIQIWLYISVAIITIYGIYTFLIGFNPLYDFYVDLYEVNGIWSEVQERGYRVNSFFENPIVYGMVLSLLSLSFWVSYKMTHSKWSLFLILLCIINVILCNSRVSIICAIIMFIVFMVLYYGISIRTILWTSLVSVVIFAMFFLNDKTASVYYSLLDVVLNSGEGVQGSSVEMKMIQLTAALKYFYESPIWGHGINFFQEYIFPRSGSSQLFGLEGYGYRMLVEMGVFMIIAFVIYFVTIIYNGFNRIHSSKLLSSVLIAQCFAFLVFLLLAGDKSHTFEYCFLIIGLTYRLMDEYGKYTVFVKNEIAVRN